MNHSFGLSDRAPEAGRENRSAFVLASQFPQVSGLESTDSRDACARQGAYAHCERRHDLVAKPTPPPALDTLTRLNFNPTRLEISPWVSPSESTKL